MPRIDDLVRLFLAVAQDDLAKARVLANAIAEREEHTGKPGSAAALRKALVTHNGAQAVREVPMLARGIAPDLLTQVQPVRLDDVKLTQPLRISFDELINEQRHRERLRQYGLEPRNRLFFHGPPGCGKTLTARALAGALGLPVYVVRFDALLGAFLGQTAARLHEIFRFAASNASVVVIDEIDAVGRQRGHSIDVAEIDRVVISLMQQLELIRPAGLIVGASNIPENLDAALVRRFDLVLAFPAPNEKDLKDFGNALAKARGVRLVNGVVNELASAQSYADVERVIISEQRRIILRKGK